MKVTVIEIEGTPEELSGVDVRSLLRGGSSAPKNGVEAEAGDILSPDGDAPETTMPEFEEVLRNVTPAAKRPLLHKFLSTVLSWEKTALFSGGSHPSGEPRYLRVSRIPRRMGSFVYVGPRIARTTFRLEPGQAPGTRFAYRRNMNNASPYKLAVKLDSEEHLQEALRLAKLAYENAK